MANKIFDERAFLNAYKKNPYVTTACKMIGVAPKTFYANRTPWLEEQMADILEEIKDEAEMILRERMKKDTTCLLFFLKSKCRDRGYVDQQAVSIDIRKQEELANAALKFFSEAPDENTNQKTERP